MVPFFRALQKGISGNQKEGCDAIVMSGPPNHERLDNFWQFFYTANSKVGGGALLTSAEQRKPIRVFRGSELQGEFRALSEERLYRYDGLYRIEYVLYYDIGDGQLRCESPSNMLPVKKDQFYHFLMIRVTSGEDKMMNQLSNKAFLAKARADGTMPPTSADTVTNESLPEVLFPPFPYSLFSYTDGSYDTASVPQLVDQEPPLPLAQRQTSSSSKRKLKLPAKKTSSSAKKSSSSTGTHRLGKWSKAEHDEFLVALKNHSEKGKQKWDLISKEMQGKRTPKQVHKHHQDVVLHKGYKNRKRSKKPKKISIVA